MHCFCRFFAGHCLTFAPRCLLLVALQLHIHHGDGGGANCDVIDAHLLILDIVVATVLVPRELILFLVANALIPFFY